MITDLSPPSLRQYLEPFLLEDPLLARQTELLPLISQDFFFRFFDALGVPPAFLIPVDLQLLSYPPSFD